VLSAIAVAHCWHYKLNWTFLIEKFFKDIGKQYYIELASLVIGILAKCHISATLIGKVMFLLA